MEEKRFVTFLILSLFIMTSYLMLHAWLFPQPIRPPANDLVAAKEKKDKGDDKKKNPQEIEQGKKNDQPKKNDDEIGKKKEEPKVAPEIQPAWRPSTSRLISLGSLAPNSPFRYLAIFDTNGATIKWLELNERLKSGQFRYRDLEDKSGYLGNLALTTETAPGGCRIHVVGEGTPAALATPVGHSEDAGLKSDDVILHIDEEVVKNVTDFETILKKTHPKDEITVVVLRGGKELRFVTTLTRRPLEIIRPEMSKGSQHPQSLLLSLGFWRDDKDDWDEISAAMRDASWDYAVDVNGDGHIDDKSDSVTDDDLQRVMPKSTVGAPAVVFRYILTKEVLENAGTTGSLEVVKRFRLTPIVADQPGVAKTGAYHLSMEIEINNLGKTPQTISYQLDGPTGLPWEGWWYSNKVTSAWSGAGARDVAWASAGKPNYRIIGCPTIFKDTIKGNESLLFEPPPGESPDNRTLRFVGGDTQYFSVMLKAAEGEDLEKYVYIRGMARAVHEVTKKDQSQAKKTDTSFQLVSEPHKIEPNQAFKQKFVLFAGPKDPGLLEQYQLGELIYYGWWIFAVVSRPLVLLLHVFEAFPLVNYGLAIILLTLLVRGCMVPISRKAALNAQMMQVLQPEMKRIADRYKNDMEKRGKAQQELFRKYNYNPFGGCLLMFFQLPIFIGLYRGLSVDIALRDQPLITGLSWCSNLAGPDQLFYWADFMPEFLAGEGVGMFVLGPFLNLLPLITVVLFLVQQKMFTPPPTDEQQVMMHKMMKFMMIFMGFMFFKVAAGLCVYFITSSLWGVIERKLLPKPKLPDHLKPPTDEKSKKSGKSQKPGPNGAALKDQKPVKNVVEAERREPTESRQQSAETTANVESTERRERAKEKPQKQNNNLSKKQEKRQKRKQRRKNTRGDH